MSDFVPVFDGHNDFLLRLYQSADQRDAIWHGQGTGGHLDLPRMRTGGFVGGLFAIFVPSPRAHDAPDLMEKMANPPYDLPLPDRVPLIEAQPVALAQAAHLLWMERAAPDAFSVCRSVADIRAASDGGRIAGVLHMEGAEAIGTNLDALHLFHTLGLRSIGPAWSRPTAFGHGVPFRFPGDPDIGPGLTPAGEALVREAETLRMLIDLSHLNAAGVEDVARLTTGPLVATHSGVHALCPSPRNLTDRQLAMIAERGGLVGVNFATVFLRPDGKPDPEMTLEPMLRQLDYLVDHLGEGGVALGSDFDGALVPAPLGDVAGLQHVIEAMRQHEFGESLIRRIASENWMNLLGRIWGA